jgi:hypothetical protein
MLAESDVLFSARILCSTTTKVEIDQGVPSPLTAISCEKVTQPSHYENWSLIVLVYIDFYGRKNMAVVHLESPSTHINLSEVLHQNSAVTLSKLTIMQDFNSNFL